MAKNTGYTSYPSFFLAFSGELFPRGERIFFIFTLLLAIGLGFLVPWSAPAVLPYIMANFTTNAILLGIVGGVSAILGMGIYGFGAMIDKTYDKHDKLIPASLRYFGYLNIHFAAFCLAGLIGVSLVAATANPYVLLAGAIITLSITATYGIYQLLDAWLHLSNNSHAAKKFEQLSPSVSTFFQQRFSGLSAWLETLGPSSPQARFSRGTPPPSPKATEEAPAEATQVTKQHPITDKPLPPTPVR